MMVKPLCRHCKTDAHVVLRRRINGNGSESVYWYCTDCGKGAEFGERAYNHGEVNQYLTNWHKTVKDIPIIADYSQESEPCLICGARDTEFNHWLPQMFAELPEVKPEWGAWANVGASLCRKHHMMWHRIVTPYMPGIGANRNEP